MVSGRIDRQAHGILKVFSDTFTVIYRLKLGLGCYCQILNTTPSIPTSASASRLVYFGDMVAVEAESRSARVSLHEGGEMLTKWVESRH